MRWLKYMYQKAYQKAEIFSAVFFKWHFSSLINLETFYPVTINNTFMFILYSHLVIFTCIAVNCPPPLPPQQVSYVRQHIISIFVCIGMFKFCGFFSCLLVHVHSLFESQLQELMFGWFLVSTMSYCILAKKHLWNINHR